MEIIARYIETTMLKFIVHTQNGEVTQITDNEMVAIKNMCSWAEKYAPQLASVTELVCTREERKKNNFHVGTTKNTFCTSGSVSIL